MAEEEAKLEEGRMGGEGRRRGGEEGRKETK